MGLTGVRTVWEICVVSLGCGSVRTISEKFISFEVADMRLLCVMDSYPSIVWLMKNGELFQKFLVSRFWDKMLQIYIFVFQVFLFGFILRQKYFT